MTPEQEERERWQLATAHKTPTDANEAFCALNDEVRNLKRQIAVLVDGMRTIELLDKTVYEHHEPRHGDGAPPEPGGTIWLTPREIASDLLKPGALTPAATALLDTHTEALAAAARRHDTTRAMMHVREEEHRKQVEALKAGNAALLADLRSMHDVAQDVMRHEQRERIRYAILERMESPHPGAELLERHAKEAQQAYMNGAAITSAALLEEHRKALEARDEMNTSLLRKLAIERTEMRSALVRARNDGLEKAASRLAEDATKHRWTDADEIRALKEPES